MKLIAFEIAGEAEWILGHFIAGIPCTDLQRDTLVDCEGKEKMLPEFRMRGDFISNDGQFEGCGHAEMICRSVSAKDCRRVVPI